MMARRALCAVACCMAVTFSSVAARATSYPKATWVVRAWVQAPGDFPSESLETVRVKAVDARGAIFRAVRRFECCWLSPTVVYVARVSPPRGRP